MKGVNLVVKVSVIIAAYNIDKYIKKCLDSVVNQTLKNIEIIVVNDGSTDKTLQLINEIASTDKRIKVVSQKNKGIIDTRMAGLKIANGEYILFIDGDDWLEISTLDKLYSNAISNDADIVMYNAFWIYDDKKVPVNTFNIKKMGKEKLDYVQLLLTDEIMPSIWAKFIKSKYIKSKKIKFPIGISYGDDLATTPSLLMYNPKVSYVNENLYNYYQREGSITNAKNKKILEIDKAVSFIKEQLIDNKKYERYLEEFEYMVYNHLFEYGFLKYGGADEVEHKLYKQYICRKINIKNNRYINEKFKNYPLSLKIRVRLYHKGYNYGKLYDKFRKLVRG